MSPPPSMFGAPREIGPAASLGDYIQPNLRYGLKIWWAFYWPTALAAIVLAIGFNSAMRLFLQVGVMPNRLITPAVWIARFDFLIFYYAGTFFAIAYILRKKFRSFRLGLFPNREWGASACLQPTMRRSARVWWAFVWRPIVYRIIAVFAAWIPLVWLSGIFAAMLSRRMAPIFSLGMQVAIDAIVGMFVIYSSILDEDIANFRVALLPRSPKTQIGAVPSASITPAHQ